MKTGTVSVKTNHGAEMTPFQIRIVAEAAKLNWNGAEVALNHHSGRVEINFPTIRLQFRDPELFPQVWFIQTEKGVEVRIPTHGKNVFPSVEEAIRRLNEWLNDYAEYRFRLAKKMLGEEGCVLAPYFGMLE